MDIQLTWLLDEHEEEAGLNDLRPAIAECRDAYRLLEINSFSASQVYACDLEAIVRAAHEEAIREWEERRL